MRISDWSSDVCSSDLVRVDLGTDMLPALALGAEKPDPDVMRRPPRARGARLLRSEARRVGKEWSVRVDLGGRRILKKNSTERTSAGQDESDRHIKSNEIHNKPTLPQTHSNTYA